ncbi:membrane hypothetical protein [Tenacibaculum maritimum]|nr:membrane hypothetical protein [Tenacibaculum maritimum]CAA0192805.1 membrane hypothetical protein [Tenacibaculum maritimum]CAA0199084.1 membrane hypothetical protein [Tenacibaculum maritimum]CAA0227579.1 membrane hypothetical protein [Tenacibaculum maritimum]
MIASYSLFVGILLGVKKLINDSKHINKDYSLNKKTLPILIGRNRVYFLIRVALSMLCFLLIVFYKNYLKLQPTFIKCLFFIMLTPLLYLYYDIKKLKTQRSFLLFHKLINAVILFGALLLFYFKITINVTN